ncbi:putative glycolipid-binding domain-containing protein [Nocardia jejuensis]|uniref:putative glycolipid-binding domain-containing protein n=1 Tax=Nocardia jejuensis TaxID=328049 RepID=UPI000A6683CA|nr:putative glycolipid-binding domain-containing protein [Nocardia jejuensis]
MSLERSVLWQIRETAGFESAWANLDGRRLRADGTVAGQLPEPYRLSYRLDTDDEAATTRLEVVCHLRDRTLTLDLRRGGTEWTVNGTARPDLSEALDCDLACSPMTNTMPVLRHDLHRQPGSHRFTMAFVELPTLRVVPSRQQYTHLGPDEGGVRVRYESGTFRSDLLFDRDGLVIDYPHLARRVEPIDSVTADERSSGAGSVRPGSQ